MKNQLTKHFLLALMAFAVLALSSCDLCCKHKPTRQIDGPIDTLSGGGSDSGGRNIMPTTVSGIIIDENGSKLVNETGSVTLLGPTGTTGPLSSDMASDAYTINSISASMYPATLSCVPNGPTGATGNSFYTSISGGTGTTATVDVILNTSTSTEPEFEAVFITNPYGSTPTMPTNMTLTPDGGIAANPTHMSSVTGMDLVIFSPISPNTKYTFKYTSNGAQVSTPFTTPPTWGAKPTFGFTFVVN